MRITGILTLIIAILTVSCNGTNAGPHKGREHDVAGMPGNLKIGQCVRCVELTETIYKDTDYGLPTRLKKIVTGPILAIGKDEITILAEHVELERKVLKFGAWEPDLTAFKGPGVEKGDRFSFKVLSQTSETATFRTTFRRFVEKCDEN